jgi:Domain of unknown function (DUF397)
VNLSQAVWQKSSYSATSDCIEVAFVDGQVALRDSKDRRGPVLFFTQGEWNAFVAGVRDGQLQQSHSRP